MVYDTDVITTDTVSKCRAKVIYLEIPIYVLSQHWYTDFNILYLNQYYINRIHTTDYYYIYGPVLFMQ